MIYCNLQCGNTDRNKFSWSDPRNAMSFLKSLQLANQASASDKRCFKDPFQEALAEGPSTGWEWYPHHFHLLYTQAIRANHCLINQCPNPALPSLGASFPDCWQRLPSHWHTLTVRVEHWTPIWIPAVVKYVHWRQYVTLRGSFTCYQPRTRDPDEPVRPLCRQSIEHYTLSEGDLTIVLGVHSRTFAYQAGKGFEVSF